EERLGVLALEAEPALAVEGEDAGHAGRARVGVVRVGHASIIARPARSVRLSATAGFARLHAAMSREDHERHGAPRRARRAALGARAGGGAFDRSLPRLRDALARRAARAEARPRREPTVLLGRRLRLLPRSADVRSRRVPAPARGLR